VCIPLGAADVTLAVLSGFGIAWAEFDDTPDQPQPLAALPEAAKWDIQVHSRDPKTWPDDRLTPMSAEHGADCAGPPATHSMHTYAGAVFVCNKHLMTAINEDGYGQIVLTPAEILDFSDTGTVQFELSTARQSTRDWPDVWLSPWAENLTLPFDNGEVDQQGVPRTGLRISLNNAQSAWTVATVKDGVESAPLNSTVETPAFNEGIVPGTNQAAIRQKFRLTVSPTHVRFERLESMTASPQVYVDKDVPDLGFTSAVVQFGHHSYNPAKDGAGEAATWHWDEIKLSPSQPFTIIKTHTRALLGNGTVVFDAPAPQDSWLRFSAVGSVQYSLNGSSWQPAPKQAFIGHYEHTSPYFVAIPPGTQSVSFRFAPDAWYTGPYVAQDFAIWSSPSDGPRGNLSMAGPVILTYGW